MKIALVTPVDFLAPGGATEHVAHLQGELIRRGHEVTVIAPDPGPSRIARRDGFCGIGRALSIPTNGSRARITLDACRGCRWWARLS